MKEQEVLDQAQALRRNGDRAMAITQLRLGLSKHPIHPKIIEQLGINLLETGEREEAISLLQISAALSPKPEVLNNLAVAHLLDSDLYEARRIALRGMTISPNDLKLRQTLATIEDHIHAANSNRLEEQAAARKLIKYSIIMPHYDGSVTDEQLLRGLRSLAAQTYEYFEVLLYHDGPLSRPLPDLSEFTFPLKLTVTETRHNNWGHTQRDMGVRAAVGEYIVHFNPDNILYPNALAEIAAMTVPDAYPAITLPNNYTWYANNNIVIFPIYLMEVISNAVFTGRLRNSGAFHRMVLSGYPVQRHMIDAMQLVMKRSLWLEYGGWSDTRFDSDGYLYPKFVQNNGCARFCGNILGEHW
ncbi:MAG: glycosyltransferase [Planctomycetes bacterium]|nr:glycosyltransferase [Planctomycetota bacterium]